MEDEHGPHLRRKPDEAALELVTIGDRRLHAGCRRNVDVHELDVGPVPAEPAGLVDARPDQEPAEPLVEAVRVPKRGQITPGSDERVLDGVVGLLGVPEDEPGGRVEASDRGACQRVKGVMIAPLRSLHEISLHPAPRRWRDPSATLIEYGEAPTKDRSRFAARGRVLRLARTIGTP